MRIATAQRSCLSPSPPPTHNLLALHSHLLENKVDPTLANAEGKMPIDVFPSFNHVAISFLKKFPAAAAVLPVPRLIEILQSGAVDLRSPHVSLEFILPKQSPERLFEALMLPGLLQPDGTCTAFLAKLLFPLLNLFHL